MVSKRNFSRVLISCRSNIALFFDTVATLSSVKRSRKVLLPNLSWLANLCFFHPTVAKEIIDRTRGIPIRNDKPRQTKDVFSFIMNLDELTAG